VSKRTYCDACGLETDFRVGITVEVTVVDAEAATVTHESHDACADCAGQVRALFKKPDEERRE
jgi:hypothetical protein